MSQQAQAAVQTQQKAPTISSLKGGILQRTCECGQHTLAGGECESCRNKRQAPLMEGSLSTLQRAAISSTPAPVSTAPPIVGNVLSSPGRPLDRGARSLMESRFGHDFSQVRVHTDPQAAESASAVAARAYTVGQHVVFGAGQYTPETTTGKHLLAHELTHTIQQQQGIQRHSQGIGLGESPQLEHEAETAATAATRGENITVSRQTATTSVQRTPWGPCPQGEPEDKTKPEQSSAAEAKMVEYYHQQREKSVVALSPGLTARGDFAPLENLPVSGPPNVAKMVQAMQIEFRSGKGPSAIRPTQTIGRPQDFPAQPSQTRFEPGTEAALTEPENELKRPDIADITNREVYDVTTVKQAGDKVSKIRRYVQQLESIRSQKDIDPSGTPWVVGETLKPPRPEQLTYQLPGGEIICFGPTDFSKWPGVLAYTVIKSKGGGPSPTGTGPYTFIANGIPVTFQIPPGVLPAFDLSGPENLAAAESVPGIRFVKLHRTMQGDAIEARIKDSSEESGSSAGGAKSGRRLPIKTDDKQNRLEFDIKKDKDGNARIVLRRKPRIPASVKGLSPGYLIPDYDDQTGFSARGIIIPSVPLLNKAKVDIAIINGEFSGRASISKDFNPPIPHFYVTQASLAIEFAPELRASGDLAFEVGPKGKPFLDGLVTASADESGFVAKGTLNAHLPGIDETKGEIMYRNSEFSGGVDINFGQTKLQFVKGGDVHVGFVGKNVNAAGKVLILLPRGKEAALSVELGKAGNWIFKGAGEFDIPGLKPVHIEILYDGVHLNARGHTDLDIKGAKGQLLVIYQDGRIYGEGKLGFERGRAKGFISAKLSNELKISGEGELQYQLSENLIGTIGVILHEDQSVRVKGVLDFPKPIQLFKGFKGAYSLFDYSMDIPILAIPLGPVSLGLIGRISGGLGVNYGIGPGELRNLHVMAAFNPLEEEKDLELQVGALLVIPAHAGISVSIRGAVGISVVIASVTGGITATGTAELQGGLQMPATIHYIRGKFSLDAKPSILAELILKLGLDADVTAEAGVWPLKYTLSKTWHLATYEWGSGLQFGMTLPIHYGSDEEFHMPSTSDIEWIKPNIDLKSVVPRLAGQAVGKED